MSKRPPMIDDDGEVRELTTDDIQLFRPASEVLPRDLLAGLVAIKKQRGECGPQKSLTKVPTAIGFDAKRFGDAESPRGMR